MDYIMIIPQNQYYYQFWGIEFHIYDTQCNLRHHNMQPFCQIAMIAQGDFLKLLISPTKERMEIFRHIFKTESFSVLQEKLKRESGILSDECTSIRRSISQYINGIES